MEHDLNLIYKLFLTIYNFDPYSVLLAIAKNIPQRLNTAFVLQGHICTWHFILTTQEM